MGELEVQTTTTRAGETVYRVVERLPPSRRCPEGAVVALGGSPARAARFATIEAAARAIPAIEHARCVSDDAADALWGGDHARSTGVR